MDIFRMKKKQVDKDERETLTIWRDEAHESPRQWDNLTQIVWSDYDFEWDIVDGTDDIMLEHNDEDEQINKHLNDIIDVVRDKAGPNDVCQRLVIEDWRSQGVRCLKVGDPILVKDLKKFRGKRDYDDSRQYFHGIIFTKKRTNFKNKKARELVIKSDIDIFDQYLQGDVYGISTTVERYCKHCKHWNEDVEAGDSCGGMYGNGYGETFVRSIMFGLDLDEDHWDFDSLKEIT